jgi:hypothetical protein
MLGSTQIVDMETTRKNNFGRVLVAVLNPSLIPEQLDVVIGDHYFELKFEVEKVGVDENGEEAEFVWPVGVEGACREGSFEGGQQGEDEGQERMSKKQRIGSGSSEVERVAENTQGLNDDFISWKEKVQSMSKEEFEVFLREKANEILNNAADGVFDEVADKVMGEEDVEQQEMERPEGGELTSGGKEVEMRDRIMEATTVSEASKMQVRASPRLQRSRDEHVLAKAEGRVARKNLEFVEGNSCPTSLLSVNRDLALNCLQQIGFNLGESSLDKDNNIYNLLDLESDKDIEGMGYDEVWWDCESEEESVEDIEKKALKSLCGELMEEIFDESSFPLNSELDNFTRKGKSHAKSCLRKTCKIRTKFSKKGAK